MNPSLPERVVDEAMERDPEAARAEYMAEFRNDLETFLLRKVVDAAVRSGPLELPYDKAHKYAGSWPADEFKNYSIEYTPNDKPSAATMIGPTSSPG